MKTPVSFVDDEDEESCSGLSAPVTKTMRAPIPKP